MIPSVPLPTDNLYKFLCLLGLALLIASIAALTTLYVSSLDTKSRLGFEIIELESKQPPFPAGHEEKLKLKQRLFDVANQNEKLTTFILAIPFAIGVSLIVLSGHRWYKVVQLRDDEVGELQKRKLLAEVEKAEIELIDLKAKSKQAIPEQSDG